jgi:predicted TPR repeat methyltransferase
MGVLLQEAQIQGFRAEGLDISADAVAYCKKQGLTATTGSVGDYAKKTKKKFHVITAFEIIEHEYEPRKMVETMYHMLYEDGLAIVTTPNHGSIWRMVMGKYWPGYQHTEHLFFFDEASLWNLFTSVGFTHVEIRKDDSRPFPLSFLFTRAADYFPLFGPWLRFFGKLLAPLPLVNPINPWDDLIVIARK